MTEFIASFMPQAELDPTISEGMSVESTLDDAITMSAELQADRSLNAALSASDELASDYGEVVRVPSGDTSDYNDLYNKPTINAVTVEGDKTGAQYGLEYSLGKTTFNDKTRVYIESSFGIQSSVEIEEGTDVDYATYNDVLAYLNE